MNKKKFWPIVLAGGILLLLIGALWAVRALPSRAAQPMPPIADLLLQGSDLARYGVEWEQVEEGEDRARGMAEFEGLSLDYLEGRAVYFVVYFPPELGKDDLVAAAVGHSLYRYESEEAAIAHYEHLLEALPLAPLGRETPIRSVSERSLKGVRGQIIETQDPVGIAYWFIGVRGNLLTVMVVLGDGETATSGQPFFEELLPTVLERMVGPQ